MREETNIPRKTEPAIARGIKAVGVGKKGSKPVDPALAAEIVDEVKSGKAAEASVGAFFGALLIKGVTPEEKILDEAFGVPGILDDPARLVEQRIRSCPDFIKDVCVRLLKKETLSEEEARRTGGFLFSQEPGDFARGLIASVLRVRYETGEEYAGLLAAMNATLASVFKTPVPAGEPIVQIADPFDGLDHSNSVTPLVAGFIGTLGYRAVTLCGRNSGPKFGNNALDIAESTGGRFLKSVNELTGETPPLGWYANQADFAPAVDRWVEIRHQTVKRPFLSTLERFMNPVAADIALASAFHPPYGEKMLTVCEMAGFRAGVIVRNGMEGSTGFPLKREAKILCTVKKPDGTYLREELTLSPTEDCGVHVPVDERLDNPDLAVNVGLIRAYAAKGTSGDELFDARVKVTCEGIKRALDWIKSQA